jgi:hypothetical protein
MMENLPTLSCTKLNDVAVQSESYPQAPSPRLESLHSTPTNPMLQFLERLRNSFSIPHGSISSLAEGARFSLQKKRQVVVTLKKRPKNSTTPWSSTVRG